LYDTNRVARQPSKELLRHTPSKISTHATPAVAAVQQQHGPTGSSSSPHHSMAVIAEDDAMLRTTTHS
jgi:hypothetical protein